MEASRTNAFPSKLVSQILLDDEDLRDIVEEFVLGLSNRLSELRTAHAALDWEMLAMISHRLKGAAGSYGYPDIGALAAKMEQAFRLHQADDFATWVNQFETYISAAREGLRST